MPAAAASISTAVMSISTNASLQRTVLITGVSRGLGRALALEMARRGHFIIGCSRSQENLNSLRSELQKTISPVSAAVNVSEGDEGRHFLVNVDVRSNKGVEELARAVVEKKRVPDIIVNNAGTINKNNPIWEVSAEEFDTVIDTNVKGTANVLRNFIPLMNERKHGIVVNMSSGWGRSAAAQVAPYCASKWAVEGLSRSVAKELTGGVAIIALSPGVVHTDMLESCFGSSASVYPSPDQWASRAATMILNLTVVDNGASLTV
ncbi:NADPH-dependent pterin aldehyde reductase-like protein [Drosera capensis]